MTHDDNFLRGLFDEIDYMRDPVREALAEAHHPTDVLRAIAAATAEAQPSGPLPTDWATGLNEHDKQTAAACIATILQRLATIERRITATNTEAL